MIGIILREGTKLVMAGCTQKVVGRVVESITPPIVAKGQKIAMKVGEMAISYAVSNAVVESLNKLDDTCVDKITHAWKNRTIKPKKMKAKNVTKEKTNEGMEGFETIDSFNSKFWRD